MTNPNFVPEDEAQTVVVGTYGYPAYDFEDNPVLFAHTGTLDTTGYGNGANRTLTGGTGPDAFSVQAGPDTSAAAINPYLRPTINPASLPGGYQAGTAHTGPIF